MKSCLDHVRELYAQFTPLEIAAAIAQYRRDEQEREELENLTKQRDEIDEKLVKFRRPAP